LLYYKFRNVAFLNVPEVVRVHTVRGEELDP
jgi:hypothetical protein